ncbi:MULTISPECIES: hypothetical protein [unclassified Microcystis]|jgi:hypothetical protein|uniref:hypothetical protein n=1 Tax=unclassified Microcystis TaxID=2643300 RepID=UPI002589F997|nr:MULTISPECIES: hypothetical protein [unclassified Microcystis]MCA2544511.1 hypothetical protein [Microcystis sp. M55BS1]MCA2547376.1 hypothetical protein [Microcystis sp. M53BS1]MCA2564727.1 hypothetical protein [Microcystis sp. M40BS1]MCA2596702.1 hypothetical protein [Microcystis sp. M38BS1]
MAGIFWIGLFLGLTEEMLEYVTAIIREFCRSVGKFALFAFFGTFLFFWMFFATKNFSQSRQLDNISNLFVISFLS